MLFDWGVLTFDRFFERRVYRLLLWVLFMVWGFVIMLWLRARAVMYVMVEM